MLTDAELVNAVRGGDRSAFGDLVARYERAVWARAWRVTGDYHAAQDATQDAFLEAFRRLSQLRRPESFALWLMRIAERESFRTARRNQRTSPLDSDEAAASIASPLADLTEDLVKLLGLVGSLPDHERTVVVLRYFEGHAVGEIAQITARPLGTVTKQLSRALERLKTILREVKT